MRDMTKGHGTRNKSIHKNNEMIVVSGKYTVTDRSEILDGELNPSLQTVPVLIRSLECLGAYWCSRNLVFPSVAMISLFSFSAYASTDDWHMHCLLVQNFPLPAENIWMSRSNLGPTEIKISASW